MTANRRRALVAMAVVALAGAGAAMCASERFRADEPRGSGTSEGEAPASARAERDADGGFGAEPDGQVELNPEVERYHDAAVDRPPPTRPTPPDMVELTPTELRDRQRDQAAAIERRIEELDAQIERSPPGARGVLEARRRQLEARRDQLLELGRE